MNLAGFAAELRDLAGLAEEGLAVHCAREAAQDYLAVLRAVTPKRSGQLMRSETIDAVVGGGAVARAVVAPHTRYAAFRNDGGTITAKKPNRRGQYILGTPEVGFFGRSVTQAGAHYMEKAEAASRPAIEAACRAALDEFLHL